MCFNQKGDISTVNDSFPKLVDKFVYLGSCISSTESDINMCLAKTCTAIDRLLIIWKSNLSDKIKRNFFQVANRSILLYGCLTWKLMKCIQKKIDESCTRILWAVLNKSWKQHPINYLPPISKTIQVSWTRHVGHCWRSKNKISDLLWTNSDGHANVGRPRRTYLQLCIDTGCRLEDLPGAIDKDNWWESQGNLC